MSEPLRRIFLSQDTNFNDCTAKGVTENGKRQEVVLTNGYCTTWAIEAATFITMFKLWATTDLNALIMARNKDFCS